MHRAKMSDAVVKSLAVTCSLDFRSMKPAAQIDTLLGKSTGDVHTDDKVSRIVTRFLKKAWRTRKSLTAYLNDKLGRADTVWALKLHGDRELPQRGISGKGRGSRATRVARAG